MTESNAPNTAYSLEELSIELSSKCNCRCIMCSSGAAPTAGSNELTKVEVMDLIFQARNMGASVISFSGGDPILHPCLPNYVQYASSLGYSQVLIYTTGVGTCVQAEAGDKPNAADVPVSFIGDAIPSLVSQLDEYIPEDLKSNIVFVFSIHSYKATVHDYITGVTGSLYTSIRAIRTVRKSSYKVHAHMVPMLPNWQDIRRVRDMCQDLGIEKLALLRYVPQTRGRTNRSKLEINLEEFRTLQEMMHALSQEEHEVQMRYGCPIDFRHTMVPSMHAKAKPCHAGTDLILVRPDGSVHPCAAWKTLPDDANVRSASLEDIWKSGEVFQAIRLFREEGWTEMAGPCSLCAFLASCKGGCPAQKLHWLYINACRQVKLEHISWPIADPLCPRSGLGPSIPEND